MSLAASVILCTRNRRSDLPEALESVWAQDFKEGSPAFEIILVDNGSSDGTDEYARECLARSPVPMRYLWEGRPGLSLARNRGAEAARGKVLAFLDDDAVASDRWLAALVDAYRRRPEAWVVGGAVRLKWLSKPPGWLSKRLHSYLGALDLGPGLRPFQDSRFPFGVNFSCLKSVWRKVGGFDEAYTLYNDERYFCSRVARQGGAMVFASEALVQHKVPPSRLTRGFFLRRCFLQGRADGLFDLRENIRASGGRYALYRVKTLPRRLSGHLASGGRLTPMDLALWLAYEAGYVIGCARSNALK